MPGAYGLSALPPADLQPPRPEEDGPVLAWKRSYYPGVALPEAASKIVVLPAGAVSGVDVKLRAAEWIEAPAHDIENVKLRLVAPLPVRGKVVMEAVKGVPLPKLLAPLILAQRGGRIIREGDMGLEGGIATLGNPDAEGN